ncbi:unnamed protein product [Sympodiomycopsis kandeliae]
MVSSASAPQDLSKVHRSAESGCFASHNFIVIVHVATPLFGFGIPSSTSPHPPLVYLGKVIEWMVWGAHAGLITSMEDVQELLTRTTPELFIAFILSFVSSSFFSASTFQELITSSAIDSSQLAVGISGVYGLTFILQAGQAAAYIGESGNCKMRLNQHHTDASTGTFLLYTKTRNARQRSAVVFAEVSGRGLRSKVLKALAPGSNTSFLDNVGN